MKSFLNWSLLMRGSLVFVAILPFGIAPAQRDADTGGKNIIELEDDENMDPPAPPGLIHTGPKATSVFGSYTSYQVNVDGNQNNILNDAANEPSIWVDPNNHNRMAIGWRQFDNVASNFRQGGYGYTTNAGLTWTAGNLQPGLFRSDPVLAGDLGSTFHYNSLQETFYSDEFASLNGGASWTNRGPATGGDKQWITIDRTNSTGSGFIYQIWSTAGNNYGGRQMSRSTDGGFSWMNPINLPSSPTWGVPEFGPNGELYVVGTDGSQPSLRYLRSSNAKNSAVTPTFDQSVYVNMGGDLVINLPVNPVGLGGQAWIACDRGNGLYRGYLYILASIGGNSTNPLDVKMRRSRDGGATWDAVVRVNTDAQNQTKYHWFGTVAVAPNGRVDAIWLDTRNSTTPIKSALYTCHSYDGGTTWTANEQVSQVFDQSLGYPNQNKMGDYMGLISDNTGSDVAYTATFSGGQDVYYLRIPAVSPTINGHITLSQWDATTAGQPIAIDLRNPVSGALLQSSSVTLNASGDFTLSATGIVAGTYNIYAKGSHWLRKKGSLTTTGLNTVSVSLTLQNGDVDGSNVVDLGDFDDFAAAFGSSFGDAGYNPGADLNGDLVVDLGDFDIFSMNFGDNGD